MRAAALRHDTYTEPLLHPPRNAVSVRFQQPSTPEKGRGSRETFFGDGVGRGSTSLATLSPFVLVFFEIQNDTSGILHPHLHRDILPSTNWNAVDPRHHHADTSRKSLVARQRNQV